MKFKDKKQMAANIVSTFIGESVKVLVIASIVIIVLKVLNVGISL